LGYQGLIVSDSLVMNGLLKVCPSLEEAALRAFLAGCDLLCISGRIVSEGKVIREPSAQEIIQIHKYLCEAVRNGTIPQKRLDEAVAKILKLKENFNL